MAAQMSIRSPFVSSTRALAPRPRISAARAPVVTRRSFVVRAVSLSDAGLIYSMLQSHLGLFGILEVTFPEASAAVKVDTPF